MDIIFKDILQWQMTEILYKFLIKEAFLLLEYSRLFDVDVRTQIGENLEPM